MGLRKRQASVCSAVMRDRVVQLGRVCREGGSVETCGFEGRAPACTKLQGVAEYVSGKGTLAAAGPARCTCSLRSIDMGISKPRTRQGRRAGFNECYFAGSIVFAEAGALVKLYSCFPCDLLDVELCVCSLPSLDADEGEPLAKWRGGLRGIIRSRGGDVA